MSEIEVVRKLTEIELLAKEVEEDKRHILTDEEKKAKKQAYKKERLQIVITNFKDMFGLDCSELDAEAYLTMFDNNECTFTEYAKFLESRGTKYGAEERHT